MATKEATQPFQFPSWKSSSGSYGINFKHLMMYPRRKPAVQNFCSVKITKLVNMGKKLRYLSKIGNGSISQYVALATVKTSPY